MTRVSRMQVVAAVTLVLIVIRVAEAQPVPRSSGIILRGTFWDVGLDQPLVSISDDERSVHVGPAGGWISFFGRLDDRRFLEFGFGVVGKVDVESGFGAEEDVDVNAVFPMIGGIRYHLLPVISPSALQPYLSFGGGVYWYTQVDTWDAHPAESVIAQFQSWAGAYAGGGMYFHLASWFALNLDLKYHLVTLDPEHDYSGLELGFGFGILWGGMGQDY